MDLALETVIELARSSSPYFQELYRNTPPGSALEDFPLTDHTSYWAASNKEPRLVMTGPQVDGVVLKTGGTTSRPKTIGWSQVELQRTGFLLASGLLAGGVRAGDRIANMFYAGSLYASFLLHVVSVMSLPIPAVHVPVGGLTAIPEAVDLVEAAECTALLTTATTLVKLANHITAQGRTFEKMRCILFGGEPLFPEQEKSIRLAFPRASVKSCIYGGIDAGVLAKAAPGDDSRLYQAFTDTVVLEIVRGDGSNAPINDPDEPGMLVATNTLRQLFPIIRYPTGDRAVWVDKENGIFRLLGRASQAVRIGPVSLDVTDIRAIVADSTELNAQGIQAVISRSGGLDQLEVVIATSLVMVDLDAAKQVADDVAVELYKQRPMFKQHVEHGLIAPLVVRLVTFDQLRLSNGSHKVLDVVDLRFADSHIGRPIVPPQTTSQVAAAA